LGLSTCQGIVEQSGGHITASSVAGHGTTFHLYLPSHDEEALEDSRTLPSTPEATPASATILVVDDEPMLRELGEAILLEAGYAVLVAEDGPSALRIFQERAATHSPPVDLLLTDVVMPGMNGVQLSDQIRLVSPGLPILYCSGFTRDAIAEHGGLPAHSAFLQKPYSVASLVEKVQALLAAR
jgi:CheY-like chemotaxis protein